MGNNFVVLIHCLAYLAIHEGERFSSQQLAHNACSNPVIVRKLMSLAVSKGYVNVTNGVNGGYQLQLASKDIYLGEIFVLVGEDKRLKKQFKASIDEVCLVANHMMSVMEDLQASAIQSQITFYNEWTLEMIVERLKEKGAKQVSDVFILP